MKVDLNEIKGPGSLQGGDVRELIPGVIRDWEGSISMPVVPNNTGPSINLETIRENLGKLNEKQKRSILSSNIMKMVLL